MIQKINTLTGHKDCVYALEQHGNYVYSVGGDGLVVAWNLKNPEIGKVIAQIPTSVYALKYIPKKNYLLIGQNFDGLQCLDLQNNTIVKSLKITEKAIFDIQIYENIIWVACGDGTVILIDVDTFQIQKQLQNSTKSARCISVNIDNQEVAVGYSDFSIKIFDGKTFVLKTQWHAHENSVFSVCYSPCGRYLLSAGRDAHLKIWNTSDYTLNQDIAAHWFTINHIIFSPDGAYFATCSMDKSIKIWQTNDFKLIKVIDKARNAGHATSVNKLYWTSYHNWLLSASDDRTVSIWNTGL
jgi:WD40 repeat protein